LTETFSIEKVKEILGNIMAEYFDRTKAQQKSEGYIKLEQGFITIPFPLTIPLGRGFPLLCMYPAFLFFPESRLKFINRYAPKD
jgi:hypothetical protein